MVLFTKKESDEKILKRLSKNAGNVIEMFKAYFKTPKGLDARKALVFTSALAGHACHRAVIANHETFAEVSLKNGTKLYFGDALNKYLLENRLSVVGMIRAVTGLTEDEVIKIVTDFTSHVADEYTVCGFDPKPLYEEVVNCWEGIYDNMTSKYCKSPSEWPVLFGIVVQNILLISIQAGAPTDEAGRIATECAVAVSKMDKESFL